MSVVDTLRVSVTDRCNLRCVYCMPPEGVVAKSHDDILRFEEIERIVRAAVRGGIRRVRLTGGEPLARRNILKLVELLSRIDGLDDLSMTTNGVLLADLAVGLKAAGLRRVTISLDSLNRECYQKITGSDCLDDALKGINAARDAGLTPIKINMVAMRGINDDEALDFARFAARNEFEVRFIELMPIAANDGSQHCNRGGDAFISASDMQERIKKEFGQLDPVDVEPNRPARIFRLPGSAGRVGFISPVTEPFCKHCSRMRLTADGKLKGCLFSSNETDIRTPLRSGAGDDELLDLFNKAVLSKPKRLAPEFGDNRRWMIEIGG